MDAFRHLTITMNSVSLEQMPNYAPKTQVVWLPAPLPAPTLDG